MRGAYPRVRDGVLLAVAAAAALVAAWIFVRYGSFGLLRIATPDLTKLNHDFDTFWHSARALLRGENIYDTKAHLVNLNPPFLTVVLAPFGLTDGLTAYRIWLLLSLALVVGSMVAVARALRLGAGWVGLAVVATMISSPLLGTLGLGQMYPLLLAGLTAAWFADRRGRWILEGIALGLVVAVKPSLGLILLLPLVRRQWWTLGVAVLTGWWATVVGWLAAGGSSLPNWLKIVLETPVQSYYDNASLPGTLTRLGTLNEWAYPLAELPGATLIGFVLAAAVVALTAWRVRRKPAPDVPDTALWALTAASLLAAPIAWHNYLVLLVPGVLLLIAKRRWPVALLLLALPLIGAEWPGIWYGPNKLAPAVPLSLYCAVLLTYWLALLPPRQLPASGSTTPAKPAMPAADAALARPAEPDERVQPREPEVAAVQSPNDPETPSSDAAPSREAEPDQTAEPDRTARS